MHRYFRKEKKEIMIIQYRNSVGPIPLDTVQNFLIKLGIKPRLYILKISIFSLKHVIVRPTKIMNNLLKVYKICTYVLSKSFFSIKNQPNLSEFFFCEDYVTRRSNLMNEFFLKTLISKILSKKVPNFVCSVYNFGRSDDVII